MNIIWILYEYYTNNIHVLYANIRDICIYIHPPTRGDIFTTSWDLKESHTDVPWSLCGLTKKRIMESTTSFLNVLHFSLERMYIYNIFVFTYIYIFVFISMFMFTFRLTFRFMFMFIFTCIHICIYICVYIYLCTYIFKYTHIHIRWFCNDSLFLDFRTWDVGWFASSPVPAISPPEGRQDFYAAGSAHAMRTLALEMWLLGHGHFKKSDGEIGNTAIENEPGHPKNTHASSW